MNADLSPAAETDLWLDALRRVSVEAVLLPILIQLALVILAARVFAILFRRLGQPAVVGEIAAGIVLGPSLLGWLFPGAFQAIFHPHVHGLPPELGQALLGWILTTLSQLGLILLLFLIGLEFDFSHLRWHGKSACAISLGGMITPFALGLGLALAMHPHVAAEIPRLGFSLFLATALSITAIPILGRMMMELNMTRTRLGAVTIAAAAVDDAVGWILLAAVAAIVQSQFEAGRVLWMIAQTVGFGAAMVLLAKPLLRRWTASALRSGDGDLSLTALAVLLAMVLACAIVTNLIGIFAVFGAFILGATLSDQHDFRMAVTRRLRDFVSAFFLPIFFAYTGLRTNIGSLESLPLWLWCGAVTAAAIAGKFGGCALAARLTGSSWREAGCIGALMNTRALMALIVINLGKDLGVIPESVFCMLILMALTTTIMTTPILLRWMRGTELEPYILRSSFFDAGPIAEDFPDDAADRESQAVASPPRPR
jgi:Kef-type K+ transport system membrane component KefB